MKKVWAFGAATRVNFLPKTIQNSPMVDKKSINTFKLNWRKYFDAFEGDSSIFQRISEGKFAEGAEMYLPLFFNKKITPIDYLDKYQKVILDSKVMKISRQYENLINERYEEYKFDIQRPLINPKDLFLQFKQFKDFIEDKTLKVVTLKSFISKQL